MRLKITLILLLAAGVLSFGQISQEQNIVSITGKLLKDTDSTAVSGNLLYEKLPYYDDVGMTSIAEDGQFSLQLIDGNKYNFSIKKEGFEDFAQEITAQAQDEPYVLYMIEIKEEVVEVIKLDNLIFRRGSPEITSDSFTELDRLATWLEENPTFVIQLEGHTDFRGNPQTNMLLSEARVERVKEYLIKDKKIKKARLFTKAFGGTQPLTREDTDEAKARNRRVEVSIISR